MIYKDRKDAGLQLASRLTEYKDREDVLVLALPRGGVVIGYEVAKALNCLLDIIIIRKIGFPGQSELAIGAVSETGAVVLNEDIISTYTVSKEYIEEEISRQKKEILRRITLYRSGKGIPPLDGKIIILVDDGVATGATIKAAISTLKNEKIVRLVAALPVSSKDAEEEIKKTVDEWVCPETPVDFAAVGNYYQDFTQVSDEEVVELLKQKTKN
jgi:putative phosphoribosyl transferase